MSIIDLYRLPANLNAIVTGYLGDYIAFDETDNTNHVNGEQWPINTTHVVVVTKLIIRGRMKMKK
jgi:hypothetical protein